MTDTITIRIGGKDWTAPSRMNLLVLEQAWPYIEATRAPTGAPMIAVVEVMGALLSNSDDPDQRINAFQIKKLLLPDEWSALDQAVAGIITASFPKPELPPGEAQAASSTGTSGPSSPNSPPAVSAAETPAE